MPRRRSAHRPLSLWGSHWREDGRPKVRFSSRGEALAAAADRSRDSGTDLAVYACEFCNGWHMGRPGGRRAE